MTRNYRLDFMGKVGAYADAMGGTKDDPRRLPPEILKADIAGLSWRHTLVGLARIAKSVAVDGGRPRPGSANGILRDVLLGLRDHPEARYRRIADYVAREDVPIATEGGIQFLQAAALLYGSEDGPAATDVQLALLLLAANDYVWEWKTEDGKLTRKEDLLANTVRSFTWNRTFDLLRWMVRAKLLYGVTPERGPWSNDDSWTDLTKAALGGRSLDEHFTLVGPVVMLLSGVVRFAEDPPPILDIERWLSATRISRETLESYLLGASTTRANAVAELNRHVDAQGLPVGVALFHHTPFIHLTEGELLIASPWVLLEQLRGGLWGAHLAEAKRRDAPNGPQQWFATFGDVFEGWCRRVAGASAMSPGFADRVLLGRPGTDEEIEDIVFVNGKRVALVSCKASTIPEATLKLASSPSDVLAWLEKFFFATPDSNRGFRGGALRLLDAKVQAARAGRYGALPRHPELHPVLLVYDEFGGDLPMMYDWLERRCRELGLLQGPRVLPVTILSIDIFERLMALALEGTSVFGPLRQRRRHERFDIAFHRASGGSVARLPFMENEFAKLTEDAIASLFAMDESPSGSEPPEG